MLLFLDTANLEEIRSGVEMGVIAGVTTNPTLLAREGAKDVQTAIQRIAALVSGPVSVEVTSTDSNGMVHEAHTFASWDEHVVVKVPITAPGLAAIHHLHRDGISTNATLVFSPNQALLAARAGATYVSLFVGRVDDISWDGLQAVRETVEIFSRHNIPSKVIAASIRHPLHIVEAAKAGAHIATIPYAVFQQMIKHPLTDIGLERFLADWRKLQAVWERAGV